MKQAGGATSSASAWQSSLAVLEVEVTVVVAAGVAEGVSTARQLSEQAGRECGGAEGLSAGQWKFRRSWL